MTATRSALALILALCGSHAARAQDERPLDHQGVARSVVVANAPAAGTAPRPALIVLHGRRDPGTPNRSSPQLDALARREGFVAVYPAAQDGSWNHVGRTASTCRAGGEIADDMGFLARLIERLIADGTADPARIYVSGTSSGGFMTYSLVCGPGPRIAAAAVLIANMTEAQLAGCAPLHVVPLLVIAGTADRIVPFDGASWPGGRLTSIAETVAYWRSLHGCKAETSTALPHRLDSDPTRAVVVTWGGCRADGALRLVRIEGGGHILPSLTPASPETEQRWGRRNRDLETSVEVWEFVRRFKLW